MSTLSEDVHKKEVGQYLYSEQVRNLEAEEKEKIHSLSTKLTVLKQEDLDTYKLNSKDLDFTQRKFRLL
jgi:hypothetical protein